MQPFARQHDACLHELFVEVAHLREQLSLGITPASVSLLALMITITRIALLCFVARFRCLEAF